MKNIYFFALVTITFSVFADLKDELNKVNDQAKRALDTLIEQRRIQYAKAYITEENYPDMWRTFQKRNMLEQVKKFNKEVENLVGKDAFIAQASSANDPKAENKLEAERENTRANLGYYLLVLEENIFREAKLGNLNKSSAIINDLENCAKLAGLDDQKIKEMHNGAKVQSKMFSK